MINNNEITKYNKMNKNISLQSFKPNIISLINSSLLEHSLMKNTEKILYKIINKNKYINKYLSKHVKISSYISYALLNNIFLHYYSSSVTDFLFNLIKINSSTNMPLYLSNKFSITKTLYLLEKLIEPILLEKLSQKYLCKIFNKTIRITDILFKLLYMLKDNFMYTNLIDYIFGIITIDEGYRNDNIQLEIILCFCFILFSIVDKYYNKIDKIKETETIEKKEIIKVINEGKNLKYIPPPNKEIFLIKNKNFYKLLKNKNGICLICNKKFVVATAIKCCGGIFCNKCIKEFLIYNKKCFLCSQKYILKDNKQLTNILIRIYS